MAHSFSTTYDDSQARAYLSALGADAPNMLMKVLQQAAEWVIAKAQDKYLNATQGDRQHLHSVTGRLSSSIRWWKADRLSVFVGTGVEYAAIHEFGGTIRAVNAPYLRFKGTRGWATVSQVQMPKRPYLQPPLEELWRSGTLEKLAELEMRKSEQRSSRKGGG